MVNVTTRSYNNYRNGANLNETKLTQAYVAQNGIRLLRVLPMVGDARGSEGMPLVLENITMRDGSTRNIMISATMGNYVYCWDDDTGALLWVQKLGQAIAINGNRQMDAWLINQNYGILSTPVIDASIGVIYVVAMTSQTNDFANSEFWLHSLYVTDGSVYQPPLNLNDATYTDPVTKKTSKMSYVARKQRCGLGLATIMGRKIVVVANGSFNEDADTNQGWIICCDVTDKNMVIGASWTTTSKYSGGGVWMGGQGCSIDDQGYIYGMTGNGAFDGISDFGECFYKLKYTPTSPPTLQIAQYFAPYTDTGRIGADPTLADTSLIPNNAPDNEPSGSTSMDSPGDEDLGSGGPLLIPAKLTGYSKDVIIGAGKDGIAYVLDANNMGNPELSDYAPNNMQAGVYAKLLSPPLGFTFNGVGYNCAPTDTSKMQTTHGGFTHHLHSTPVFYNSPKYGPMLFCWGENEALRAWALNKDFSLTYLGCGTVIASAVVPSPGGMPGGMITLSAHGNVPGTGLIHALVPYGDANKTITNGRYIIYAADNIQNGIIQNLWDSNNFGADQTFTMSKFNIPCVSRGLIRVADYSGNIRVYG